MFKIKDGNVYKIKRIVTPKQTSSVEIFVGLESKSEYAITNGIIMKTNLKFDVDEGEYVNGESITFETEEIDVTLNESNYYFFNGTWFEGERTTLEEAYQTKRNEINESCQAAIEQSIEYTAEAGVTHLFPCRKDPDQLNLLQTKEFIQITGQPQEFDGVLFTMTDVANFAQLFAKQKYEAFNTGKALKERLKQLYDNGDLTAILEFETWPTKK